MLAQQAAEEEEKDKPVDQAAGADVPSGLSEKESQRPASEPEHTIYIIGELPVEIEQTPRKEEERESVGKQMGEIGMDERMRQDAEKAACPHRTDPHPSQAPRHAGFYYFQHVENKQQQQGRNGCQDGFSGFRCHFLVYFF